MASVKKFIHSFTMYEMRVLGRWNLEQSLTQLNQKIDMANEDHCGNCNQYRLMIVKQPILPMKVDIPSLNDYDKNEEYIRFMM